MGLTPEPFFSALEIRFTFPEQSDKLKFYRLPMLIRHICGLKDVQGRELITREAVSQEGALK